MAVRECYNTDVSDIQKNIESIINSGSPSKDVRFLDYALYSSKNIIGGNPEIVDIMERIKSIKSNPVFIYGTKYPIWMSIPEGKIRENMKLHLENINNKIIEFINNSKQRIKELFLEEAKKEQYLLYSQHYAIYDYSMLPYQQYYGYQCYISRLL